MLSANTGTDTGTLHLEQRIDRFLTQTRSEDFATLALEIFAFQRQLNRPYARYCEFLNAQPASWREVPAVPQEAFKRSQLTVLEDVRYEFRTSGTTGEGYGRHFLPSLHLYQKAVLCGWDFAKIPQGNFFFLMQSPQSAPFSSLSRMGAFLSDNRESAFYIDTAAKLDAKQLRDDLSARSEPTIVFGTALAFVNLLEDSGWQVRLPEGSALVETGGFKGSGREIAKTSLYRELSDRFAISLNSIWNEYGMTELSSQFYARGTGQAHRAPPWVRFLVIDPRTGQEAPRGQVGLLRIYDLANLWSVLGVQTQDLAIAENEQSFLLLGRDPTALPRGCSRAVDELIALAR